MQSLLHVRPDYAFDIIRRAATRNTALYIYDRAEGTCEWTAPSGVKASRRSGCQMDTFRRKERRRHTFDIRQIVHVIIDRLQVAGVGVDQHFTQSAFGFAREKRDAEVQGLLNIRVTIFEHRHRS